MGVERTRDGFAPVFSAPEHICWRCFRDRVLAQKNKERGERELLNKLAKGENHGRVLAVAEG
jgi:hypothetical protein